MRTQTVYQIMRKEGIPRRSGSEANYRRRGEPSFKFKDALSPQEEQLHIAGVMLYWGEGTKKGKTVDFSNSDPQMVRVFVKFLREVCRVSEERLRAMVYCHSHQKADDLEEYWSQTTEIPRTQFIKAYIREGNPHKSGRVMEHGLIKIRYHDKRLLQKLMEWKDEIVHRFMVK